jgi:N4-gp56 family major capsid protein
MASTQVLSGLELTKWRGEFAREYVRDSGFSPYMGDSPMDIISVVNDLKTDGYTIRIPLVGRLQGGGVSGSTSLSGAEEQLDQYYQDISWEYYRNAIVANKKEKKKSAVELMGVARPLLKEWATELIKYQLIDSFHKMSGGLKFTASDATARNLWSANNVDRVLYGATTANYSATHATGLTAIDNSADKLSTSMASLARFMARQASPHIRPFKTGTQGREYFVMFCHPLGFRDLKADTAMLNANRDARARDVDSNPLFQDGDLVYDGIIFREIPEFYQPRQGTTANPETTFSNGTIVCGVSFLCGAQALGFVNKQAPLPTKKAEDDYGFVDGVGIELAHGIDKLRWNNGSGLNKDVGMVTVYHAAVA